MPRGIQLILGIEIFFVIFVLIHRFVFLQVKLTVRGPYGRFFCVHYFRSTSNWVNFPTRHSYLTPSRFRTIESKRLHFIKKQTGKVSNNQINTSTRLLWDESQIQRRFKIIRCTTWLKTSRFINQNWTWILDWQSIKCLGKHLLLMKLQDCMIAKSLFSKGKLLNLKGC